MGDYSGISGSDPFPDIRPGVWPGYQFLHLLTSILYHFNPVSPVSFCLYSHHLFCHVCCSSCRCQNWWVRCFPVYPRTFSVRIIMERCVREIPSPGELPVISHLHHPCSISLAFQIFNPVYFERDCNGCRIYRCYHNHPSTYYPDRHSLPYRASLPFEWEDPPPGDDSLWNRRIFPNRHSFSRGRISGSEPHRWTEWIQSWTNLSWIQYQQHAWRIQSCKCQCTGFSRSLQFIRDRYPE